MNNSGFKQGMENLVDALQDVCGAYSEIPDILEFEGGLSLFDKKFGSLDKGDMTLLMSLFDMRVEGGEVKQSSDGLGYHIAKAIYRLEYMLAKDDVRGFLQGYFHEGEFSNPAKDRVEVVMESIRGRDDSEDVITALRCIVDGGSEKQYIINDLKGVGESDERAEEIANKVDVLNSFKLLAYARGWITVKEQYHEYVKNALETDENELDDVEYIDDEYIDDEYIDDDYVNEGDPANANCMVAIKAATEAVIDYCYDNNPAAAIRFNLVAISLRAPPEIVQIASDTEITRYERITIISNHEWLENALQDLPDQIEEEVDRDMAATQVAAMIVYSV